VQATGQEQPETWGTVRGTDRIVKGTSPVSCPCFSRSSLTNDRRALSANQLNEADFYLFFDVFDYYGLDPRRTEARAVVSTPDGLYEEVASVYITTGAGPDDTHLICHRQEIVAHPVTGEPTYHYETLAPSVAEAEACRQAIVAAVGTETTCQGPACGVPYSEGQLSPDFPAYGDEAYRTPESLLDAIEQEIEEVGRMIKLPA
jgi:hypothetical protein